MTQNFLTSVLRKCPLMVNIAIVALPCNISQLKVFMHFVLDICDSSIIFYFEDFSLLILKSSVLQRNICRFHISQVCILLCFCF
jgi:hypothetical protein